MSDLLINQKQKLSIYAKEKRKENGETVRDFADSRKVSKSQISKFETGFYDDKVSPSIAISFCRIYEVKYDDFIANYDYQDNPKVIKKLGTDTQIAFRLTKEFNNKFGAEVCESFYNKNKDIYKLSGKQKVNYLKPPKIEYEDIYIEKTLQCLNKNNEKIIITYFTRPYLFTNKPRSESYRYMGKAISDVSCYDKSTLDNCNNYVFITASQDEYNFYSSKKYNKSPNNLYIIHVSDGFTFTKPKLLFGKAFL